MALIRQGGSYFLQHFICHALGKYPRARLSLLGRKSAFWPSRENEMLQKLYLAFLHSKRKGQASLVPINQ